MEELCKEVDNMQANMDIFLKNKNKLALIYNDYTNNYGKEYYLASLSNTLINAFNTFEKFYSMIEDKLDYTERLKEVSFMALSFFEIKTMETLGKMSLFKKRKIIKKEQPKNHEALNQLLLKIDEINEIITASCEKFAKEN